MDLRTKEEQEEEEMKHLNKRLLIYQVAEQGWEANETQVKAGFEERDATSRSIRGTTAAKATSWAASKPACQASTANITARNTNQKGASSLKEHVH